jgi:hypothetical protein
MTTEKIQEVRDIIAGNPAMGRSWISQEICRMWEWTSANGAPKDIAARDMLRALEKAGEITLPPPLRATRRAGQKYLCKHLEHDETPMRRPLREILPIHLDVVKSGAALDEFKSYIDQYHYLGFYATVGENMKYMARGRSGTPVACLLYGSAAWSCKDRDCFIGWGKEQRSANLMLMTNNMRFLIFPWVQIAHLASHILALASRRISGDWMEKYGHGLACLETFVDERFRATCYRAANWIKVGTTAGRGRDGGHHGAILPKKDIYLYPLDKDYRKILRGEGQRRSVADGRHANGLHL